MEVVDARRLVAGRASRSAPGADHGVSGHVESLCHSHVVLTIALTVARTSRPQKQQKAPEKTAVHILTRPIVPFMVLASADRVTDKCPHEVQLSKTP